MTSQTKKISIPRLTRAALLTALLAVSAYITIPIGPVSLTLQTLMINMAAILLTPAESFASVLVYILLGAIGLPVFAGGKGGFGVLFGPTGGYILAFLISAPLMSYTKKFFINAAAKFISSKHAAQVTGCIINAVLIGMITIYLLGTVYMKLLLGKTWLQTLSAAVFPFIPLDLAKCAAASVIAVPVKNALDKSGVK